ncbi:hypothetical protein ACFMJC_21550, partial [Acinetobacter baumannii]
ANTPQSAREQILKTQALTENPFQVNFFCHQSTELNVEKVKQWLAEGNLMSDVQVEQVNLLDTH